MQESDDPEATTVGLHTGQNSRKLSFRCAWMAARQLGQSASSLDATHLPTHCKWNLCPHSMVWRFLGCLPPRSWGSVGEIIGLKQIGHGEKAIGVVARERAAGGPGEGVMATAAEGVITSCRGVPSLVFCHGESKLRRLYDLVCMGVWAVMMIESLASTLGMLCVYVNSSKTP